MSWQPIERNLRRAMRAFSLASEGGEARDMPGVTLVSSGVDYSVFNSAMLSSPAPDSDGGLDRRAAVAAVHFSMRRIGWSFWLCEDLLDPSTCRRAGDILARCNLRRLTEAPGMLAEALEPPLRPLPWLDYRRVADYRTRGEFCHVTSIAFHLPFGIAQTIYGSARFWQGDYRGWIGYRDSQAVATAATLAAGGAIGLYSVATLPEHRRQGCAEAIARHALAQASAESGEGPYVLQSTPAGYALYEQMGYRTAGHFTIYVAH
ncbi:MAG: GNAT family N-acetyltransferase [Bryobacterales bacterium]|nr:GNAT family N-acetyltransferase [Bryobacterales bacterium]